jgi:hypothetical protein
MFVVQVLFEFNLNTCTCFALTGSLITVMNLLIISGIKMYRKLHNCLTKHTYAAVSLCLSISDFFLFVSDQDVVCS